LSVGQKLPDDWEANAEKFRLYAKENLCGVDPAHFGNMDEVPISFDLPGSRTVHLKGAKEVSLSTTGHEKLNFTVVLSVTSDRGIMAGLRPRLLVILYVPFWDIWDMLSIVKMIEVTPSFMT
jgi:hypothetical protein